MTVPGKSVSPSPLADLVLNARGGSLLGVGSVETVHIQSFLFVWTPALPGLGVRTLNRVVGRLYLQALKRGVSPFCALSDLLPPVGEERRHRGAFWKQREMVSKTGKDNLHSRCQESRAQS